MSGLEGSAYDLVEPGQRAIVAAGGLGGHGNKRFASSTRQAPRFAERGLPGESGWIELRLKLLADAGLIGLPNAGKSSLLARLTRAAPKVADYPFTTLEPVLGTIDDGERQLVLADIPGLIEGAATGAGLGHEFLAHVERCRVLVHLIAIDQHRPAAERVDGLLEDYATVRAELDAYGAGLERLPEIVAISKRDLIPEEEVEALRGAVGERLGDAPLAVLAISSATGAGLEELTRSIFAAVPPVGEGRIAADDRAASAGEPEFEAEHIVYTPQGGGFEVKREDDAFRVTGRGVEMLVGRHDLSNLEALAYLEQRLREIGVIAALERAGFEPGDEVRIGDEEFELDPGLGSRGYPRATTAPMTVVVKLGSSIVADADGVVRGDVLDSVCAQVTELHRGGEDVAMVTSGAIALGMRQMGFERAPADGRRAAGRVGGGAGGALPRLRGAARGARACMPPRCC